MIIYKITNNINGKIYIGQTIRSINVRINEHIKGSKSRLISSAFKKYGIGSFKIETLEIVDNLKELNEKESFWIKELNCLSPNGYNLCIGGKNGRIVSEETKQLQSKYMIGKTGENHPSFGHKKSNEFKQIRAEYMKNRIISDETHLRMSNAAKLRKTNIKKCLVIHNNIEIEFNSLTDAAKYLGYSKALLSIVLKHKNGSHSNFSLKIKDK